MPRIKSPRHPPLLLVGIDGLVALVALTSGCGVTNASVAANSRKGADAGLSIIAADASVKDDASVIGDAGDVDDQNPVLDANVLDSAASTPDADASDASDASSADATGTVTATFPDASQTQNLGTTGPQVCGFSACAPGAPCPDLIVDIDDLRASTMIDERTFAATDCAIVEGCIQQTGLRRLLRFDTAAANVGTGDLSIGDPMASACFQYSDCHMHYHFKGVGQYTLYQANGTTVAAVGHKQGFCMEDVEQYQAQPGPMPATPYTCTNQGLHVGWEDVYPNDIDCQWIDITGVPSGQYVLSVIVNNDHYLPESNYENNEARVPVTVP